MSHRRVAFVLASLVATLTLSAGLLLALERMPVTNAGPQLFGLSADPLAPNPELQLKSWDYIIVYESGLVAASAADLAEGRLKGDGTPSAARPGAKFHFVVDAARGADGELVRGSAWLEQQAGAPNPAWPEYRNYSKFYTYSNAVGICLVGDVTKASNAQSRQLNVLVQDLRSKLKIPAAQVLFQWELRDYASPVTPAQKAFADSFRRAL